MTTNEILGWLCTHLLAVGAGMCLGFGFYLTALAFALTAIMSVVALHKWLYEGVTPGHTSEDDYEECGYCVGDGKVYSWCETGTEKYKQAETCAYCGGTGVVRDE